MLLLAIRIGSIDAPQDCGRCVFVMRGLLGGAIYCCTYMSRLRTRCWSSLFSVKYAAFPATAPVAAILQRFALKLTSPPTHPQQNPQGQIFLDCFNPILENAIKPRLMEGKREPCELKVSDFDDAMYTLEVCGRYMCGLL